MSAIGMIEVFGLIDAITVADDCLKTANINLIGIEKVSSGLVTVKISGDIGAITSAIESIKERKNVISNSIIANIYDSSFEILKDKTRNFFEKNKSNSKLKESIEIKEDTELKENIVKITEENIQEDFLKQLERKTVKELIEIIVKEKNISYKDAKKMKKEEIIKKIKE